MFISILECRADLSPNYNDFGVAYTPSLLYQLSRLKPVSEPELQLSRVAARAVPWLSLASAKISSAIGFNRFRARAAATLSGMDRKGD
jgi:hypothetical protein